MVGFVGSLEARHGVRRLAELASVPGIRPVVIGDGSLRRWLSSRLPQAKLTGALETGDLTVALASLDLLVHPGEHETCCHALREAAASGTPVVAPRSGGAPHVVRNLETGLLYDAADPHGLRRAVPPPWRTRAAPCSGPGAASSRWRGTGAPRSTSS